MTSPAVELRSLTKTFDTRRGRVEALSCMDLTIAEGEMVALLGPSGCGKTTTLRSIAGLEQPSGGEIVIGGDVAFSAERGLNLAPEVRRLGMVFQSYALWPHMSVGKNLAYPLSNLKLGKAATNERVRLALETVSCSHLVDRFPGQLSGGQQQRVALARALAYEPRLLLFDEPLSNLDAKLREKMRAELAQLQQRLGFTGLYVTHDQTEAMTLADRIVVMSAGRILQVDRPENIYERPASAFVAHFMGSVNFVRGRRVSAHEVEVPFGRLSLPLDGIAGDEVLLGIRPERIELSSADDAGGIEAKVLVRSYLGHGFSYVISPAAGLEWTISGASRPAFDVGASIKLRIDPAAWLAFTAEEAAGLAD